MKYLIVDTPKGQVKLDLKLVAEHRANYYAIEVDGYEMGSAEYLLEVDYCLNDNFQAIDWVLNNSNPEEWQDNFVQINNKINVTDDEYWRSSDNFKIINE